MLIPSLPTDNLYKFFFVAGLLVMGSAIYLSVTEMNYSINKSKENLIQWNSTVYHGKIEAAKDSAIAENYRYRSRMDSTKLADNYLDASRRKGNMDDFFKLSLPLRVAYSFDGKRFEGVMILADHKIGFMPRALANQPNNFPSLYAHFYLKLISQ